MNPIASLLTFYEIHKGMVPVQHESVMDAEFFRVFDHIPYTNMILDEVFRGIFVDSTDHYEVTGPSKYLTKYGIPRAVAEEFSGNFYLELSNLLSCHFPNVTPDDLSKCEYAIVNDYDLFLTYNG